MKKNNTIPLTNEKIREWTTKIGICAMTGTLMLSSVTPAYRAYAAEIPYVVSYPSSLSVDASKATTYDLSDVSLIKDVTKDSGTYKMIQISITKSGTYVFTGDNKINDAYVDVQIIVNSGVTANLVFDGVTIRNDDCYESGRDGSGNVLYGYPNPVLDIKGTANVYVKSESEIAGNVDNTVSGTLNMLESVDGALLKINRIHGQGTGV